MHEPHLDPTKHYLQIFFWPTDRVQPHPDMALHPFDSNREVHDCFNRYIGSPSFNVAQAHFLRPGQPLEPYVQGGASDPLDPDRWHLHVEYERRPVRQGVVPTVVITPHNDHAHASVDFERYRAHVVDGGGRMIYAAILPPTNSGQSPIVIVGRLG